MSDDRPTPETDMTCGRCGLPFHEARTVLTVEGGSPDARTATSLCLRCAASLSRWMARRSHAHSRPAAAEAVPRHAGRRRQSRKGRTNKSDLSRSDARVAWFCAGAACFLALTLGVLLWKAGILKILAGQPPDVTG